MGRFVSVKGSADQVTPVTPTISFDDLTNTPTTLAGYGITDGAVTNTISFSSLTIKPTTLAGYGITDAASFDNVVNYDVVNKGNVTNETVVFDRADSAFQKVIVDGPINIEVTGFLNNKYSELIIQFINGGLFPITMPVINWMLPATGAAAVSFSSYLSATGRESASLQSNGVDFILIWSDGTGVLYGKLI